MATQEKTHRWKVTGKLLITLNIIAAVALLLAQGASLIRPDRFWLVAIMALSYPVALGLNLAFVVIWALHRHRFAFISAAVIVMGYDKMISLYQPGLFAVDVKPPKTSVKLLSYNVRLFDLYNWSGNLETRKKIVDLLKEEAPEIACFQEYYQDDLGKFENNKMLSRELQLPYRSVFYGLTLRKDDHWGLATFSKYPIIGEGKLLFEAGSTNFGIYSDIVIATDTIRVYNVHLQSNHFKQRDYAFIANPDSGDSETMLNGARHLLRRIRNAAIKRGHQTNELALHMANAPYPVLLTGDFNEPPYSYTYQVLRKQLEDAFVTKGNGFGITYQSFPLFLRLDYIMYQPENFMIHGFHTKQKKFSDHYPISARFSIVH